MSGEIKRNDPIHGNIYHLKLLMLFLYRGINEGYCFRLGAEKSYAQKFEDLVFEYTEGNKKFYRLLQAKHTLDESKKITAESLLTDSDTDYSLIKYFFSYMELKKEKLFQSASIKDVILCTNINFDFRDLQKSGINVVEVSYGDNILDINLIKGQIRKQPKRYKFDDSVVHKLKLKLDYYWLKELARKLTDFMLNSKTIAPNTRNFKPYHTALASEVIDVPNKIFRQDFIENKNLTPDAAEFRILFEKEIESQTGKQLSLKNLNEVINKKTRLHNKIKLMLRKDFGKGDDKSWPVNVIPDDNVKEFLNHLIFAVNQLNEEELGIAITEEIGCKYNEIITENIYHKIFHDMLNCLQGKNYKGENADQQFHSYKDGKRLIDDARKQFLNCTYRSCKERLDSIDFPFQQSEEVQNFITSAESKSMGGSLWLISTETPFLISVMLYQASKAMEGILSHHYFYWDDLLLDNRRLISDFQCLDDFFLLITCLETINTKNKLLQLRTDIQDIFSGSTTNTKKIIIVASINTELKDSVNLHFKNYNRKEVQIEFDDTTFAYQKKLLESKCVHVYGKKMSIGKLISSKGKKSLSTEDVHKINLNAPEFNFIVQNSEIKVLNDVFEQSSFNYANYDAHLILGSDEIKTAISSQNRDIFAFFGNESEIKKMFGNQKINIERFNNDLGISHRFILLNLESEIDEFNQLIHLANRGFCDHEKPILHKIKALGNDEWLWIQTYSQRFYVPRYIKPQLLDIEIFLNHASLSDYMVFCGFEREDFLQFLSNESAEKFLRIQNRCFFTLSDVEANMKFNDEREVFENSQTHFHANQQRSVHWLNLWRDRNKMQIQWHKSVGNMTCLRKSIIQDHDLLMPEENLIQLNKRLIVLAGDPGIGKSSTLHQLTEVLKRKNQSSLVLKIELSKNQDLLTSHPINSVKKFIDVLCDVSLEIEKNLLTQKILTYKMEFEGEVILLCDGFDEVSIEKQAKVLDVFHFILRSTKVTLFITTRLQFKDVLEKSLSVLSYSFKILNTMEQVDYLSVFWDTSFKFLSRKASSETFEEIAKKVISHFKPILIYEFNVSFTSFPLVLRMLAEKCIKVLKCVLDRDDPVFNLSEIGNINIRDIYEEFVCKKYNIYFFQKLRIIGNLDRDSGNILTNAYSKAYGYLALKEMCKRSANSKEYIMIRKKTLSLETLSRIGLIQVYGGAEAHFLFPSLVDYFATELVCFKFKSNSVRKPLWDFLLNEILIHPFSRKFFNAKLDQDKELLDLLSINENKKTVYGLLLEQINSRYKQVALWKAASDSLETTVAFLVKVAEDTSQLAKLLNSPQNFSNFLNIEEIMRRGSNLCASRELQAHARSVGEMLRAYALEYQASRH